MTQQMTEKLHLLPQKPDASRSVFKNEKEYDQFRRDFAKGVREDLDRYQLARQKSEETARRHRVY